MKPFKFFQRGKQIINSSSRVSSSLHGLTIYNCHESISDTGELNIVFYWADGDNIRREYSLEMFCGPVQNFAPSYECHRDSGLNENQYLPKVPRIESLTYENREYRQWNHEFQNPNTIVEIFYKLYRR